MESLFPDILQSLTTTANHIAGNNDSLRNEQQSQYTDLLSYLDARLQQLNSVLHFEFNFTEDKSRNILDYFYLLHEYQEGCAEKIEYMFDRETMFGDNSMYRYERIFLEEVLLGIQYNAKSINDLFGNTP